MNEILAKNIKFYRTKLNMSQNKLGQLLSVTQQAVGKWEKAIAEPDSIALIKLSNLFNISIDTLIGQSENKLPISRPDYELSEKFLEDYVELLKDNSFMETTKLFNAITPELRALALGYIVGILQKYNVDTKKILGY
ncbi:MAG TPA: helix-turn-helix transcriptional regulator [Clostridia bacterium]|nr:helix-turn-helix transcriptional regulator [Clostridia bacterium]